MLKFFLIEENEKIIRYEYYPEGEEQSGVILFSKTIKKYEVERLAPNDKHRIYALKMFGKIRQFIQNQTFEKEGLIAWY